MSAHAQTAVPRVREIGGRTVGDYSLPADSIMVTTGLAWHLRR